MKAIVLAVALLLSCTSSAITLPRQSVRTCIVGPQQPAVAAAAGYNCLAFYDDFTSSTTIDVNGTKHRGFLWYTTALLQGAYEPANEYSVANSILSLNTQPRPGGSTGLHTIAPLSRTRYVGRTFQAPFYIEYKIAVSEWAAPGGRGTAPCGMGGRPVTRNSWPAVWMEDATMVLAKTYETNISGNYAEIDGPYEFYVGCNGEGSGFWSPKVAVHYWTNWNQYKAGCDDTISPSGIWDNLTFHVTGALIKTVAQGRGTGSVTFYQDGSQIAQCTWKSGQPLQSAERANFVLFLNPGIRWALHVDYVEIWVP